MAKIDKQWSLQFQDGDDAQKNGYVTPLNANLLNSITAQLEGITELLFGATVNYTDSSETFTTDANTHTRRYNITNTISNLPLTAVNYYEGSSSHSIASRINEVTTSIATKIENALDDLTYDSTVTDALVTGIRQVNGKIAELRSINISELKLSISQIKELTDELNKLNNWNTNFTINVSGEGNVITEVNHEKGSNNITVTKTTLSREDISGLEEHFVAKDGTKVLSTNDYTTAEQTKLSNITAEATKVEASTTNGNIKINGNETTVYTHPTSHEISFITGLQDALDTKQPSGDYATKSEAQGYADAKDDAIATAKQSGDEAQSAVDTLRGYVGEIPSSYTEQKTVIAYIDKKAEETLKAASGGDGTETAAGVQANLTTHAAQNTHITADERTKWDGAYTHSQKTSENPHNVTKANVGLANVLNTGDSATPVEGGTTKFTTGGAYTELAKKVDKVNGMGLSTNDLTNDLKNNYDVAYTHSQASHAPVGAEKNQNAFSKVTIDSTTIEADTVTDTLTLVAGSNITLTPDATNNQITIAATIPTKDSWNYDDSYVKYTAEQSLDANQKSQARSNIGAGTSNFSGNYNDLTNKPATFDPTEHTHSVDDINQLENYVLFTQDNFVHKECGGFIVGNNLKDMSIIEILTTLLDLKPEEPECKHTFSEEWSSDESAHWHAATCGHSVRNDEAGHEYGEDSDECSVCGYVRTTNTEPEAPDDDTPVTEEPNGEES